MAKGPLCPPLLTYHPLQVYHTLKPKTHVQITSINLWKCYSLSPPALPQHIPLQDLASWRDFCLLFVCLFSAFVLLLAATFEVICKPALTFQRQDTIPLSLTLNAKTSRMRWRDVSWSSAQFPRGCVFQFVPMNSLVCNHTVYYRCDN